MRAPGGKEPRQCWIANAERLDRLEHFAKYSLKQRAEVLRKGYLGLWAPAQAIKIARKEADLGYAVRTPNFIDDMRDFNVVGAEVRQKILSILDEVPPESYEPPLRPGRAAWISLHFPEQAPSVRGLLQVPDCRHRAKSDRKSVV